jgi:hypothetical protein
MKDQEADMSRFKNPSSSLGSFEPEDKPTGFSGRGDDQGGDGNSIGDNSGSNQCSQPKAGVVIRAFVEHIGLVGDTELTVNVKWPASTFCVQQHVKPTAPTDPAPSVQLVPGNGPLADIGILYGESVTDPVPVDTSAHLSDNKKIASKKSPAPRKK